MDTTTLTPPAVPTTTLYERKFQMSGWVLGGVGAVVWAANSGRKGKFWWFIAGSLVGSTLGYLADSATKKKTP